MFIAHRIFPVLCMKNLKIINDDVVCAKCGRRFGFTYGNGVYIFDFFRKYTKDIEESESVKKYSSERNSLFDGFDREWEDFLRDVRSDTDKIYAMGTDWGWIPEDSNSPEPGRAPEDDGLIL